MTNGRYMLKAAFSALILFSFFINSFPVKAQDIVDSDDVTGGASVFVFRQSRKAPQAKFATRNFVARSTDQKAASRKKVNEAIARVNRSRPNKPSDSTVAYNQTKNTKPGKTISDTPPSKALTKVQLSDQVAGFGDIYLSNKNYDEAIKAYRSALVHNSQNQKAKLGLSEALVAKGSSVQEASGAENALTYYDEAKTLNPQNAAAYAALGGAYEDLKKKDAALQNYAEAVRLNPDLKELYAPLGGLYYEKGEIAKADEFLSKAAPDDQTKYLLGVIRYKQNRNAEALVALNESLSIKDSAEAHYYLGEVYDQTNQADKAIAEYTKATTLNPKYTEAWFDLGAAYYNKGEYAQSINPYKKAIELNNSNSEAYENLGDAYRQLKRYTEAESQYTIAIGFIDRKMPDQNGVSRRESDLKGVADLYSKQGFVQGKASSQPDANGKIVPRWGAAINSLENAVKISPDGFDYTNLGWAYYNASKIDEATSRAAEAKNKLLLAKNALQKAVDMNVNNAGTYMNLGLTQNDLGEFNDAIGSFNKALTLRKDWVPALTELGFAYRRLNQFDEAVKYFRRATSLNPKYVDALYKLSEAEFRRGNLKEARKAQEALRNIDPNSKYLQSLSKRLDAIFLGASLTNQQQQLENKVKGKIPKLPF